jgi:hypothetical protein
MRSAARRIAAANGLNGKPVKDILPGMRVFVEPVHRPLSRDRRRGRAVPRDSRRHRRLNLPVGGKTPAERTIISAGSRISRRSTVPPSGEKTRKVVKW